MTLLLALLLHQQTAPNQNNRYVKFTCMEGRLRVAYTILYGDLPAENERRKLVCTRLIDGQPDLAVRSAADEDALRFHAELVDLTGVESYLELEGAHRVRARP